MGLNEDCGLPGGFDCLAIKQHVLAECYHRSVIHPGHEFEPFCLGAVSIDTVANQFACIDQAPAYVGQFVAQEQPGVQP